VAPGGIVRWPGPDLLQCELAGRRWLPFDGACWYPIDLDQRGDLELVRRSSGGVAARSVRVGDYPYPVQELEVEEKYVAPPADQLTRIERERKAVAALFGIETPRRFTLPLAPPIDPLPDSGRFGARRVFNGRPRSPHSGADYRATTGTVVRAVADGKVALAADHYFAGKSVYIDHGDGLVSMSFHLSEILVETGREIRAGEPIGRVGATGRVTGPHLHFGLRWHGARVDPGLLLGAPASAGLLEIR
jgi:murein DD-endopeptidase MepM/ murein hydrolase activator NlpD